MHTLMGKTALKPSSWGQKWWTEGECKWKEVNWGKLINKRTDKNEGRGEEEDIDRYETLGGDFKHISAHTHTHTHTLISNTDFCDLPHSHTHTHTRLELWAWWSLNPPYGTHVIIKYSYYGFVSLNIQQYAHTHLNVQHGIKPPVPPPGVRACVCVCVCVWSCIGNGNGALE